MTQAPQTQNVSIEAAVDMAVKRYHAKDLPMAESILRQILAQAPDQPMALHLMGVIANDVKQYEIACELMERSVQVKPGVADFYNNLSVVYRNLGRLADAVAAGTEAVRIDSQRFTAYNNRGIARVMLGHINEALADFEKSVAINPSFAEGHDSRGLTLLMMGRLQEGWTEQEWRWKKHDFDTPKRDFGKPQWHGEDLKGKRILLHAEQGFGDCLQFMRYVPLLADRGAHVILEVHAPLISLAKGLRGVGDVIEIHTPPPEFDYQTPMLSIPLAYGTTLETVPAEVPYITADAGKVAQWRERLAGDSSFKVGVVWAGSRIHKRDRDRSMALSMLAPLAAVRGVKLYRMQMGAAGEQTGGFELINFTDQIVDFGDTAAFAMNLDLIISVDTSPVHLCGALARPVWLMLPFISDWRWLMHRGDSPWYPTMRIFRQQSLGDWGGVVSRVAQELGPLARLGR